MNYHTYNKAWIAPSALGGAGANRPYPLLYFRLQSEINRECDDLERRGVRKLSPEVLNDCVNRINTNVRSRYPNLAKYADNYEKNTPVGTYDLRAYGVEAQFAGVFLGLIALLLAAEWAGRRRYYGYSGRYPYRRGY